MGEVGTSVKEVKLEINGRMTELIEAIRKIAHAQGLAEGRAEKTP